MKEKEIEAYKNQYRDWATKDLIKAVTIDRDNFMGEVLPLMEDELRHRDVTIPKEYTPLPEDNPLYGVDGWLRLFIIVTLYGNPLLYAASLIFALVCLAKMDTPKPNVIWVSAFDAIIWGFLILRGMKVAAALRDIKPRAVRDAKHWLLLVLGGIVLLVIISLFAGVDIVDIGPWGISPIIIPIWYRYFSISKRVRATYPDSFK